MEALPWMHLKAGEQMRVGAVGNQSVLSSRTYEEGTSENEAAAEEEEGEEEASPDVDGCPALKVGRAGSGKSCL